MHPRRAPAFPRRWAAVAAIGGGLFGVLAFPRFGWWPMAAVSVAALSLAVDGRRARTAAWLGFLYGAAFLVPLLSWTGIYVGPAPWLILAVAFATFFALLGAVLTVLTRLPGGPFWVGAAWVLQEALRDRLPFGGFPWGRLAFSQADSPLRWFAAVGGAPLVSFVVAVAGGGLAAAVRCAWEPGRGADRRRRLAPGVAVFALAPLLGLLLAWPLMPAPDRDGRTETVALVQGGLPDLALKFESRAEQVLDNHVAETLKLAAQVKAGTIARPSLVLWPENASDVDPFDSPEAYAKIERAVRSVGVPVLVGAILNGPGPTHRRNVGILWSPTTGPGAEYVKRHPVPFAEYIPLRGIAEAVSSDAKLVTQDMVAGHGDGLLRGGAGQGVAPIGDVICFEVAYDDLIRSSVSAGAQLLVVQTNNATFGHTAETYQQLAMSQLRAVETGRAVLQVATTGKSAVIGPDGRVRTESGPLFAPAILDEEVPLRTAQTLATRLGPWPEYVLAGLSVLGIATVAWQARRRRRGEGEPAFPPSTAGTAMSGEMVHQ
ncbi:apolipoprotein N-acyltransferase [uncultured Jatrophihabitans sp.]|uniref:apolipoprotein N-acyltransferase n=1 Tax=uncultured Jatrophihabitans sp. TaxID=1610747 RepID=UPI0035CB0BE1